MHNKARIKSLPSVKPHLRHLQREAKFFGTCPPTDEELAKFPAAAKLVYEATIDGCVGELDDAITRVRVRKLRKITRASDSTVRRGLRWLARYRMMPITSFVVHSREDGRCFTNVEREVRGNIWGRDQLRHTWRIPQETRDLLQDAPRAGRGGARVGAGRPKGSGGSRPGKQLTFWPMSRSHLAKQKLTEKRQVADDSQRRSSNSNRTPSIEDQIFRGEMLLLQKEEASSGFAAAGVSLPCGASGGASPPPPPMKAGKGPDQEIRVKVPPSMKMEKKAEGQQRRKPAAPSSGPRPPRQVQDPNPVKTLGGVRLGGSVRPVGRFPNELLPRFPGIDVIKPLTLPGPSLLKDNATDEELVDEMVEGFRTAIAYCYRDNDPAKVSEFRHGLSPRDRLFTQVLNAAREARERGISPVLWSVWSMQIWQKNKPPRSRPPWITWVYSVPRIIEKAGWYGCEMAAGFGGNIYVPPAQRELLRRYRQAQHVVGLQRALPASELKALVNEILGPVVYESLVAQARREIAAESIEMKRRVDSGQFLW